MLSKLTKIKFKLIEKATFISGKLKLPKIDVDLVFVIILNEICFTHSIFFVLHMFDFNTHKID